MTTDERLDRIEELLRALIQQRTVKEWYSTAEVADLLGKAEFIKNKRAAGRARDLADLDELL